MEIVAIVDFGFAFATNKAEHHPEKRTQKKGNKIEANKERAKRKEAS